MKACYNLAPILRPLGAGARRLQSLFAEVRHKIWGNVMPKIVRIPITNLYMGGDYTGQIFVGPNAAADERYLGYGKQRART